MNVRQSMRSLVHVMATHLRSSISVKSVSVVFFVSSTFIQMVSPNWAFSFLSNKLIVPGKPPIFWNTLTAFSEAKPRAPLLVDWSKIPQGANEATFNERQSSGIVIEKLRPIGALKATARIEYIELVRSQAEQNGLPADIADAVVYIESGYHPEKVGSVGEIGLMQIRPRTAAMLGFRGSDNELAVPETNIRYGVTYLARAWRLAEGDLCRALMKYRAGYGQTRMTSRSVEYCGRAKIYLRNINSSLAMNFSL
jgi:soluble lytic murein transglycosylase-like protein